ncbi:MAG: TIGR02646 family protein [Eubacterium sp.]|nr:TIGR02646 family protein [Eubacterium sp.]
MIAIKKGDEPEGLKELRDNPMVKMLPPKEAFKELRAPLKEKVFESLKRDQGQLCVYCMSRIPREDKEPGIAGISIEHFIPLTPGDGRDVGQGLDYQNLYAVCHGNMKRHIKGTRRTMSIENLTCDKHRENTEFRKINPCREETLQSIFYKPDGQIDAEDPDVRFDLVVTLNLNCVTAPLVSERKAALDALIDDLGSIEREDLHSYCAELLRVFMQEENPKTPYVGIIIWYLKTMV